MSSFTPALASPAAGAGSFIAFPQGPAAAPGAALPMMPPQSNGMPATAFFQPSSPAPMTAAPPLFFVEPTFGNFTPPAATPSQADHTPQIPDHENPFLNGPSKPAWTPPTGAAASFTPTAPVGQQPTTPATFQPAQTVAVPPLVNAADPANALPPMGGQPLGMAVVDGGVATPAASTSTPGGTVVPNFAAASNGTMPPASLPTPGVTPGVTPATSPDLGKVTLSTPASIPNFVNPAAPTLVASPSPSKAVVKPTTTAEAGAVDFASLAKAAPAVPTTQAPTPTPMATTPKQASGGLGWIAEARQQIDILTELIAGELGIHILANPDRGHLNPQITAHEPLWQMRWNSASLPDMPPKHLCAYEVALTTHQVYVQTLENKYTAMSNFLGKEKDRILRDLRRSASGNTEKDKDNAVLASNPDVVQLYIEHRVSEYMAGYLKDLGERFAQMQNGLKRTIDIARLEMTTNIHQAAHQH